MLKALNNARPQNNSHIYITNNHNNNADEREQEKPKGRGRAEGISPNIDSLRIRRVLTILPDSPKPELFFLVGLVRRHKIALNYKAHIKYFQL